MRQLLAFALAAVTAVPLARADTDVACWYRDLEQIDTTMDPPQAGDNTFFTSSDVPPNLLWILDNSGSMRALACATGSGCSEYARCGGGFQSYGNDYFTSRGYPGYTTDSAALDAFDPEFCNTPGNARDYSGKDGCYKPGLVYRGLDCGSWPSGGQVWTRDASSDAAATIPNWCLSNYATNLPNPANSPSACNTDDQCPSGYSCRARTGSDGTKSCFLDTLSCNTPGYTCPSGFGCNATTGQCENPNVVQTPPNPFDPYDDCSSNSNCRTQTGSNTGYICVRSNGTVSSWYREYCYLGYGSASAFPYRKCSDSGYACPDGYDCNSTSGECEKLTTEYPPFESSDGSCSSDSQCSTGYVCITAGGGTTGNGRRCRLPLAECTTGSCPSGFACDPFSNACVSSNALACMTNLRTYGYHNGGGREDPVFTGDLLNFSPPKFVIARKVLKDLVPEVKKTRQALITFDTNDNDYGQVMAHLGPTCDKFKSPSGESIIPSDSVFGAQASTILTQLNAVKFDRNTPLGETLTTACQYVTSDQNRFRNDVMVKGVKGVGGYDSELASRSGNNDSMCFTCQKNFVVIITDGLPTEDSSMPSRLRNYGGLDSSSYLDDVANFCHTEDLRPDLSGHQNVTTHTIAFGIETPILEDTAELGGGIHLSASDATQLRNAVAQVVAEVNSRATSFSVASVTTVQTRGSTYAFVPRFRPFAEDLWEGHLYRFKLFNEFAAGCTPADTAPPMTADKRSRNLNGDGDCDDVFLLDKNNMVVQENGDGAYMLADTTRPWDDEDGWPLRSPATPATPVWDAAEELLKRSPSTDPRAIYTVIDADGDGELAPGERLEFTVANVAALLPRLALGGAGGDTCTAIAKRKKMTNPYATETACAQDVIRFVRGEDIFDEDRDGSKTDPRPRILGDIFHSSPILVTAPVPSYMCDLGITAQCLHSLYGDQLTPGGRTAYEAWTVSEEERTQMVVVGANDGMIHAFHAGAWVNGDDPDTTLTETRHLDLGTGRELWAFIPPDMLPKLKRLFDRDGRHELFVDGTPMVRDVWVDLNGDGQKSADEFRTMAVVGERQGGRSYTALDITDPAQPVFRWTWPPPGSAIALDSGETWNDFAPAPPPIGPVGVVDATGPLSRGGDSLREQWAVVLGGGYDPSWRRGRSLNVLDVWTGQPIWRFAAADATDATDLRGQLGPVAATPALLDMGASALAQNNVDGLFDTVVFADVFGQVWVARLFDPAEDTNNDGLADNWHAARAFVQHDGGALSARSPFFQMPEATVAPDTGMVRAYLGGGDRANVRSIDGGTCGLSNLSACVRKGCQVQVKFGYDEQGDVSLTSSFTFAGGNATAFTSTTHELDDVASGHACTDRTASETTVAVSCGSGATATSGEWTWSLDCDWSDSDGSLCNAFPKPHPFFSSVNYDTTTNKARFYALTLFDADRHPFTSASEAADYDDARLTDADLGNADFDPDGEPADGTLDYDGYFVEFGHHDERAASPASILGGCVYWNTLKPDVSPTACGSKVEDEARLYRAHYTTGSKSCGSITQATTRTSVRTAIVPPPPPTPVVSFNKTTGEVRYSMVAVEPGVPPQQVNVGAGDLAGTVYWLEVPREVHDCRHGAGTCD